MTANRTKHLTRLSLITGIAISVTAIGIGTAAAATPISAATVLPGTIGGPGASITVAHPSGGVVEMIAARDGDVVEAGDVLFRVEDNGLTKRLAGLKRQQLTLELQLARLGAEAEGESTVALPATVDADDASTDLAERLAEEQSKLDVKNASINSDIDQVQAEEIATRQDLAALLSQRKRLVRALKAAAKTATATPSPTSSPSASEGATTAAQIASVDDQIASARSTIAQSERQITKLRAAARADAATEQEGLARDKASLELDLRQTEQDIAALTVRAPGAGTITNSQIQVAGEVIGSGAPVMQIVSGKQGVTVTARVPIADRSAVSVGQPVRIELTSSDPLQHPALTGTVRSVSAAPQQANAKTSPTYTVLVDTREQDVKTLSDAVALDTGSSAQMFFDAGDRTVLDYLISPLLDRAELTFRER